MYNENLKKDTLGVPGTYLAANTCETLNVGKEERYVFVQLGFHRIATSQFIGNLLRKHVVQECIRQIPLAGQLLAQFVQLVSLIYRDVRDCNQRVWECQLAL